MNTRTKKIFENLRMEKEKVDAYNFTDSDEDGSDPYNAEDTENEYIPSPFSESSSENSSGIENIGSPEKKDLLTLHEANSKMANSVEIVKTFAIDQPFSFEYDNDFDGISIFNQKNLTILSDYFGKSIRQQAPQIYNSPHLIKNRYKNTVCKFCEMLVVSKHFSRHLERKHTDERQVKELVNLKSGGREKKQLLTIIRNEGNMDNAIRGDIIPKKRKLGEKIEEKNFVICPHCKGFYRRLTLSRHVKKCFANMSNSNVNTRPLMNSLIFATCTKKFGEFLNSSTVKKEIFSKMQPDDITTEALRDVLVVHFGEDLLKKSKLKRKIYHISNKLRECGRFLLEMKKFQSYDGMISLLRPENFDNCLAAVRSISRFDITSRSFGAASLALHFRTTLIALCDLGSKLILRKKIPLPFENLEMSLRNLERFKNLVDTQWATEIGSLALKDLNEKGAMKSKLLPVTEDIMKLVSLVNETAEKAYEKLKYSKDIDAYKVLVETSLVATILHNRKRVGDVQYLDWKSCEKQINKNIQIIQSEFTASLTEKEKILTQNYYKITSIGKGSRPVTILIPKKIQKYFSVICKLRKEKWFPEDNTYFFTYPKSKFWIDGCSVMRKYSALCGAKQPELLTSNRLRKHIASVTQLLGLKRNEIDQLAKFMGHTSKTHETFYKLPQDVYQVAKVSKILQIMEKGNVQNFKNKTLDEVDIDMENIDFDSDIDEAISSQNETSNKSRASLSSQASSMSPQPGTSSSAPTNLQYENSVDIPELPNDKTSVKNGSRLKWTMQQKNIMKHHFTKKLNSKTALRKGECEEFLRIHKDSFPGVTWLKVKTFIFNEYRTK